MDKRTAIKIKEDYLKIEDAAKEAKSLKELSNITGLSYSMIRTSLGDTKSLQRIKVQLARNKRIFRNSNSRKYLIDSSIVGSYSFRHILRDIISSSKIILTDNALKTLKKMEQFHDVFGNDSRFILEYFEKYPYLFEVVNLENDNNSFSKSLLDYCYLKKNDTILLTSNKALYLASLDYGINVKYLRQPNYDTKNHLRTLFCAEFVNNRLQITDFHTDISSVRVLSKNLEFNSGTKILKVGDIVYVAMRKTNYITFVVFEVTKISEINNCKVLFSKKIYNSKDYKFLESDYIYFLKSFFIRHNH